MKQETAIGQRVQHRCDSTAGFSVAEMLVCIQVMIIAVLTALPVMNQVLRTYRLHGAAHEIATDLQAVRLGAVMENHHYRFLVVDTHTIKLHDDTNGNDTIDIGETVMTRNIQTDNPGVQINTGSSNVTFVPNGTASTYGTITVSNESVSTETAQVLVSAGGRVRIP